MSSQYFINQTDVSSALLLNDSLGHYCRTNLDNISINKQDGMDGSNVYINNNNFYVLYESRSGWILYDNISADTVATTKIRADPTNIDWYLSEVNIGKIVINGAYPAFPRIGGRLRLQCIRCPIEGGPCNNFTYEDLSARRKAHIFASKNHNISSKFSEANKIKSIHRNRVWAHKTQTTTNNNAKNLFRKPGTNILIYKSNTVDASGNLDVDASGNPSVDNSCKKRCSLLHTAAGGAALCYDPDVPYTK
jgi:hypothetical protein